MRAAPTSAAMVAAAAIAGAAAPAAAHVAPSEDTNNRYVKLTPMADRVRIAYTILIGQAPGRVARTGLDRDGDGVISDAEADRWGRETAEAVRAQLALTIDGEAVPVTWSEIHVGLGTPEVRAGTFSLDLIAWPCVPGPTDRHAVDLVDTYSLTPAGETEVRIADEPGIRVEVARVGAGDLIGREGRFQGLAAPLASGLRLTYAVTTARPLADGRCASAPPPAPRRRWLWPVAAALALLAAAAAVRLRRR